MATKKIRAIKNGLRIMVKNHTYEGGEYFLERNLSGSGSVSHFGSDIHGLRAHIDVVNGSTHKSTDHTTLGLCGSTVIPSGNCAFRIEKNDYHIVLPIRNGMNISIDASGATVHIQSTSEGKIAYATKGTTFKRVE